MVQNGKRSNGHGDPALSLSTIAGPADVVEIDGQRFDLLNFGALGLRDRQELQHIADRLQKIERKAKPTPADITEHRRRLLELGHRVLPDAPADVLEKLDDGQLEDLGVTFFVRGAARSPRLAMMARTRATSRIGATSSPDSPPATASTRARG
jgi:hypothetical protein